jgi:N-acetylneuraminic acid mutarotase
MAALDGVLVLYGGAGGAAAPTAELSDTWTWDGTTWTQLDVMGPPGRDGAVMARIGGTCSTSGTDCDVDSDCATGSCSGGTLVLFGGEVLVEDGDHTSLADTWTWNGAAWTQMTVTGPSAREYAVMAPLNGKLVLFGGESCSGAGTYPTCGDEGDTWTWDGTAWAEVATTGPGARAYSAMATLGAESLLVGGQNSEYGMRFSDTWEFDGTTWTSVPTEGPPWVGGSALTSFGGQLVLFANQSPETWTWNARVWTQLEVGGPPNWWGVMATQ